ncbi:hypothetical protein GJV85_01415 [Sulfurimonas aquatica]|uniref:MipA/OmpV family protein n=1 Tax=Sulfurimonas aquatica TaxID=2672570 RepID=A0A975AYA7_9BACT|nr:MipA/OmpV family protein [Sulfurimonas aquatica]QSZ40827.1 hypothetical protein GJV85_01415 [Sulfurimonas aquatica]
MKVALLFLLSFASLIYSKEYELELGLGVGALSYPNYIGSKSSQYLALPIPFIRYRGENFRIDEDGINGELFGINGLKLELSMSGSLPASSDKNGARKDMPDLDLSGEIGFEVVYNIYDKGISKLELEFPFRAVFSTNYTRVEYRGITSNPQLKYSLNYKDLTLTFRTGIIAADDVYHSYYYSVKSQYATAQRDAYEAHSGFGGFKNRVGLTYKKGSWWSGAFISYFNVKDAVYKDSPLLETDTALYYGVSLAYIFYTHP